jgi:hypothetical protein
MYEARCADSCECPERISESTRGPAIRVAEAPQLRKKVALERPNSVARFSAGIKAEADGVIPLERGFVKHRILVHLGKPEQTR